MKTGFEDAFTEAQTSVISLALELLEINEKTADMIYVYMYQSETQIFFNAFFGKDKKIVHLNDWFTDDQINEFFDCGEEDIDNIAEVCEEFEHPCPCEFKLIYNVNTGSFDADYQYDDVATDEDMDLVDLYHDWMKKCGEALAQP